MTAQEQGHQVYQTRAPNRERPATDRESKLEKWVLSCLRNEFRVWVNDRRKGECFG